MGKLIDFCKDAIVGTLRGFDRLVFQGRFRCLQYAAGAERFFQERGVLFKDAKGWMQDQSEQLTAQVDRISREATGVGIQPIRSSRERKEQLVHDYQEQNEITNGIIGAWSCVEECSSYRIRPAAGRPVLVPVNTRCKHLYLYLDHPTFGFMSMRLQTWMPYVLQIAINGREWLGKSLGKAGVAHERRRNKFLNCGDFVRAQRILDRQAECTDWNKVLFQLTPLIFPRRHQTIAADFDYNWYCWQSEWATDFIFRDIPSLHHAMEGVLQGALLTGTTDRIMRYFDRATNADGRLRSNVAASVTSRMFHFADGARLRHWLDRNSVKIYNQYNTLRIETTINNPGRFKLLRAVGAERDTRAMPMRKGVIDMTMRAKLSNAVNERTVADLQAAKGNATCIGDIIARVGKQKTIDGRNVRSLRPFDNDRHVLQAIADPAFSLTGITNADIRKRICSLPMFRGKDERQLAGVATRTIRLLRDHGILRKYPRQRRYQLTSFGRELTRALEAVLQANITALTKEVA